MLHKTQATLFAATIVFFVLSTLVIIYPGLSEKELIHHAPLCGSITSVAMVANILWIVIFERKEQVPSA